MESIVKTQKRTSHEINHNKFLRRFTTEKGNWFKQVHVIQDKAYLMLMSTKSDKKGIYVFGSLEYKLDNLPNFIKRHIDFSEIENVKETLNYRAFGLIFRDGKLMPRF